MARIFVADGREHPDPDASLSIERVRDLMADFLPDLAGATWTTTERGEDTVIDFTRRVGTKGQMFPTGQVVMTRNFKVTAEEAHGEAGTAERMAAIIKRHVSGDWGMLSEDDIEANNQALQDGDRLLSSYEEEFGFKVWIITEADRSATTILLPADY